MCVLTHQAAKLDWEAMWAPYDEDTYQAVLEQIAPDDIVVEIGAGDLRLARRMAAQCQHVVAIEIQENLVTNAIDSGNVALDNLSVICGDARQIQTPPDATVGVLLMRHCTHFKEYAEKCKLAGVKRLITNARWGMGVEVIDLSEKRIPYSRFDLGWYACWCGQVGFKPGPVEHLNSELFQYTFEVKDCPQCSNHRREF
ncbi:MAG: rRNA adenine N-6-methyltransferase family protein [Anaerolineales bacterium]